MINYTIVFTLLSLATFCQSRKSSFPALPMPSLTKITAFDPPGFTVEWEQVKSDNKNPVTGFKVKVWESEKEAVYHFEDIKGQGQVLVKELKPLVKSVHIIPNTEPLVQIVEANVTKARFENVKLNEDYQIRVQAFNSAGDEGPYSNALGINLHDSKK